MKFGNKMLKSVTCKYADRMLINYGKLLAWESQYSVKIKNNRIVTFIQENEADI